MRSLWRYDFLKAAGRYGQLYMGLKKNFLMTWIFSNNNTQNNTHSEPVSSISILNKGKDNDRHQCNDYHKVPHSIDLLLKNIVAIVDLTVIHRSKYDNELKHI